MNLEFTNIGEMVATQARRYQDRIAIRYYDRDITFLLQLFARSSS
ncbi:MAG: hypothetical protein ABFC95_02935 [Smithella sp.]